MELARRTLEIRGNRLLYPLLLRSRVKRFLFLFLFFYLPAGPESGKIARDARYLSALISKHRHLNLN